MQVRRVEGGGCPRRDVFRLGFGLLVLPEQELPRTGVSMDGVELLVSDIRDVFSWRKTPRACVREDAPSWCSDYNEARAFEGLDWREVSPEFIGDHSGAFSFFTGEAFRYYLPSLLLAVCEASEQDCLAVDTLLVALDRSNLVGSWDELFVEQWVGLVPDECEVVARWILWLLDNRPVDYNSSTLGRALDTIVLLRDQALATPIASK